MIYFQDWNKKDILPQRALRNKTKGRKVKSDQDSFASLASYPVEALAKTGFAYFAVNLL
jgi:hypothetical protein